MRKFIFKPKLFKRKITKEYVFPGEYEAPKNVTSIPGPKSKSLSKEISKYQEERAFVRRKLLNLSIL